jgi:hypothetical protein
MELSSLTGSYQGRVLVVFCKEGDPLRVRGLSGLERGSSDTRAEETLSCCRAADRPASCRAF